MENTKIKEEDLNQLKAVNFNTVVLSVMFLAQAALMIAAGSYLPAALVGIASFVNLRQFLLGRDILKRIEVSEKS